MAIDTTNKKLALMEEELWEPGMPMVSTSSIDQGDKQELLWDYPGILWQTGAPAVAFILDMNTRIRAYLVTLYTVSPTSDLTTLMQRYFAAQTGDYDRRFRKLVADASA